MSEPSFEMYAVVGKRGGWFWILKRFATFEEASKFSAEYNRSAARAKGKSPTSKRGAISAVYKFVEMALA